jgi:hypothetical protein
MRNAYRRRQPPKASVQAYMDLINTTLASPPQLSRADVARMCAGLAKPRSDDRPTGDLFEPSKQGS